ncbi:chemosensory receptor c [Plakobranchus ocellatus]|uniref:Chemosensory receptor c n=1 Tax=Plakobranchus ocellatus TaxID=259542 RepID=A0AAV4D5M1_9GAST|nr:chemosensory receptor c [Plakobranchus ocellatus]
MNATLIFEAMSQTKKAIGTELVKKYLLTGVQLLISGAAVCFNLINISTFLHLGLKDSSTVCFFALSVADFLSAVFTMCLYLLDIIGTLRLLHLSVLRVFPFLLSVAAKETAAGITTYIALQRALCVASPFFVRQAFTRKRSALVICIIFAFYLSFFVLRASNVEMRQVVNPATNASVRVLFFTHTYQIINLYLALYRNVTVFVEQGTMIICIVIIAQGLRSSRRLKERSGSKHVATSAVINPSINITGSNRIENSSTVQVTKKGDNKENQAVQQCLAIVILHVVYSCPRVISRCISLIFPIWHRSLFNKYFLDIISVSDGINAAAQFVIYMRFNKKYKEFVSSRFRCRVASQK